MAEDFGSLCHMLFVKQAVLLDGFQFDVLSAF